MDPSWEVLLLEKSSQVLAKVKVSGGGRCNVTHDCTEVSELIKAYPRGKHFLRKAFSHFTPVDTREWFTSRGVPLKTESDGRVFPVSNQSQDIIDCLRKEADRCNVRVEYSAAVADLQKKESEWQLTLTDGRIITATAVCLACGGFNKLSAYDWLVRLGHTIIPPVPSLFTFNLPHHPISALMGVSLPEVRVRVLDCAQEEQGPLLITHWGLSGPAVLRLSAWCARELAEKQWRFRVSINWLPQYHENSLRELFYQYRSERPGDKLKAGNEWGLPKRLWNFLREQSGIDEEERWGSLDAKLLNRLVRNCCIYEVQVEGKTTFKEEFVTAGGVSLSEIDPHTMQSKKWPGLYFAGELMDVDGITGGYNFQNAWSSGWIAARAITGGTP
ncbi:MAG: NAD(P)/FAD-dependent oxidoreductase [Chitinophagaceae bacterium]